MFNRSRRNSFPGSMGGGHSIRYLDSLDRHGFGGPPRSRFSGFKRILKFGFFGCFAAGLTLFGISACESLTHEWSVAEFASKNECELRYEGVGLTVIENRCGESAGLLLISTQGQFAAPLVKPEVTQALHAEGCAAPNQCRYLLDIADNRVRGQLEYSTKARQGVVEFEIDPSGHLTVVQPS